MTQEELDKIVEQHQHWIKEDCEGWEDMRASINNLEDQEGISKESHPTSRKDPSRNAA